MLGFMGCDSLASLRIAWPAPQSPLGASDAQLFADTFYVGDMLCFPNFYVFMAEFCVDDKWFVILNLCTGGVLVIWDTRMCHLHKSLIWEIF